MLLGKKVLDYNQKEVLEAFGMVKEYLKITGNILNLGGYRVKYIDYHIVREIEGELWGFEDELVYVGKTYSGDKEIGDTYMGMHEKQFNVSEVHGFLKQIDKKDLERIIVGVCASRALRKERNI